MTIVRRAHRGAQTPAPVPDTEKATKVAPAQIVTPAKPYSCSRCAMQWSGLGVCHCSGCHLTWSGITAFDQHRTRAGGCLPPEQVKGVERLVDGVWRGPEWSPDKNTFGGSK